MPALGSCARRPAARRTIRRKLGASGVARFLVMTLLLVGPAGITSCAKVVRRSLMPPFGTITPSPASRYLKAHLRDGHVWVLDTWQVDPLTRGVTGSGDLYDVNRSRVSSGAVRLPADSVAVYETNELETASQVPAMVALTAASAVMTAICISSPKTCFGSCPTFYVRDQEAWRLSAEGFSSSVAPCLEATDIDAFYRVPLRDTVLTVRMRNEALETHVVRSVDLLLVPRRAGGRAFHAGGGAFVQGGRLLAPRRAVGPEGDCLSALEMIDGRERCSLADSVNLAERETIELEFPDPGTGRLGLVIAARQSLVTTYLFYQSLAYMGKEAGWWLASLDRGGQAAREASHGIGDALGRIDVERPAADGRWIFCGSFGETGPLATDTGIVPLLGKSTGPVRLRLRLARGCWRIDGVALTELGEEVTPLTIRPSRVLRGGRTDDAALRSLLGAAPPLLTVRGDDYDLVYNLPPDAARFEPFLQSRGYYLEWMRDEWVREENQDKAVELFLDPEGALRNLAPRFKAQEAAMEAAFWGSRFERERGHDLYLP